MIKKIINFLQSWLESTDCFKCGKGQLASVDIFTSFKEGYVCGECMDADRREAQK